MAEPATRGTFQFELVSPEQVLSSEPAKMVVVPASEGDIGVLAGHVPLLSALRPGVVLIRGEGDTEKKIFLAGGFVDITQDQCTVLAEGAVNVDDLDQAAVEQEIADLKEDLNLAETDQDRARAEESLKIAKARLSAVTGTLVL